MKYVVIGGVALATLLSVCAAGRSQDFSADLAELRKVADDPNAPGREEAIRKLAKLGMQNIWVGGTLDFALQSEDPKVRLAGARALAAMGPAVSAPGPLYFKALRDRDVRVRQAMVGVLSHIGPLGKRQPFDRRRAAR